MKKWLAAMVVIVLGVFASLAGAAASEQPDGIEIRLKVGDEQVWVNGEAVTVKKPFAVNGTTLVPLRVITTSFGAEPTWIAETQTIVLHYDGKSIELTSGGKQALVDGAAQELPVAPQIVDGTTMVPLRFILENFGANVNYNNETGDITITGSKQTATSVFGDEAKTKVGDSHQRWTMAYPSGLVQEYQSFNGESVQFADAKGEYSIYITKDTDLVNPEPEDMLDELSKYTYGVIRDKRLIREDGKVYAKIVERDSDGANVEYRAYLRDGYMTVYIFTVHQEEHYKDSSKAEVYNDLINSFTLEFAANDPEVKDISVIQGGYISYKDDDYGISLLVPSDWEQAKMQDYIVFYQTDKEYALYFSMSSLQEGDTTEKWANRHSELFVEDFEQSYRSEETSTVRKIAGETAIVRKVDFNFGDNWRQYTDVFVVKGQYKYNFTFEYNRDDYKKFSAELERMISSISIDPSQVDSAFGYVEDQYDKDRSALRTISSKDYGFSVKVPRYWSEGSAHNGRDVVEVLFTGGSFKVTAIRHITLQDAINVIEYTFDETSRVNSKFKVVSKTPATVNGATGQKFEINSEVEGLPLVGTTYVLQHNQTVYVIAVTLNTGVRSPENLQRVDKAVNSIAFTN